MKGYFISANVSYAQMRLTNVGRGQTTERPRIWSRTVSMAVCAHSEESAQKQFGDYVRSQPKGENPREAKIHDLAAAEFIPELLTETGGFPLDWPQISQQMRTDAESATGEYLEQGGYWLDEASLNNISGSYPSWEGLRHTLPEDIRSGLNWSDQKQFFFLFCVQRLASLEGETVDNRLPNIENGIGNDSGSADGTPVPTEFGRNFISTDCPSRPSVQSAVLVRARNAAVGAWLWRRHASNSKLTENRIVIEQCGILGADLEILPDEH